MPGGPFFNCYPGPFSNVRCRIPLNRLFSGVTPLKRGQNRCKFLKSPYLLRYGFEKVWFFLHSEMPKSGVYLEKTVFFSPLYHTPDYPKCEYPL